jgi:hypothetical protein
MTADEDRALDWSVRRPATSSQTPASPATDAGDARPRPSADSSGYSSGGCDRGTPAGPACRTAGMWSRRVGFSARALAPPPIGAVPAPGGGPGWRGNTPAGGGPSSRTDRACRWRRSRRPRRTRRRLAWCAGAATPTPASGRVAAQDPPRTRCPWWESSARCGRRSAPTAARYVASVGGTRRQ